MSARKKSGRVQRLVLAPFAALSRIVSAPVYGLGLTLTVIALVTAALLHVWTRLEIIRIGHALSKQTEIHRKLLTHQQRLRLELATRKNPAEIERRARDELHMAPPDPASIRVLPAVRPASAARARRRDAALGPP